MAHFQVTGDTDSAKDLNRDRHPLMSIAGRKLEQMATDFKKGEEVLNAISSTLRNRNMDKSTRLYGDAWTNMSGTPLFRRLRSPGELDDWLNANTAGGKLSNLCAELTRGCRCLTALKRYVDKVAPVLEVVNAIHTMHKAGQYTVSVESERLDSCAVIRAEVRKGVEQFDAVMDVVKAIQGFAPPGVKEYIQYNTAAFDAAKKAFDIANRYADVISKLADETNAWYEAMSDNSSWCSSRKSAELTGGADEWCDIQDRGEARRNGGRN